MKVENRFVIDAPIEQVWDVLTDLTQVATCLPGTELTDAHGGVFSGSIRIKVGPVTAQYRADAEVVERDVINRRALIDCAGKDSRGGGEARAAISAHMKDLGDKTEVDLRTELNVTGRVSQFGRGVVQEASDNLIEHFCQCVTNILHQPAASTGAVSVPGTAGSADPSTDVDGLDLVTVAGPAVVKRALPMAVVALVVVVLLLILV